jgi:orotidine-5'-phosphate decarboxylase
MNSIEHAPQRALCLAVDAPSCAQAAPWVSPLAPHLGVLKLGLELFVREGPAAVRWAQQLVPQVFLDLKLHDIPETVDRAVAAAAALNVRYLTVHAQGGARMLERAAVRAQKENPAMTLLAVTLLTSLAQDDLLPLGIAEATAEAYVLRLARMAQQAGIPGLVCSGREVASLRQAFPQLCLVTPGIRLAESQTSSDDQQRTCSAQHAIAAGADVLVVGRPLREAANPIAVAQTFLEEIRLAWQQRGVL